MKYSLNNKLYKTLASCYEDNKEIITVGIATIRSRLQQGWEIEKAMLSPAKKTLETKLGSHMVEGVEYPNLPSIAEKYKILLNTIYKRYSRGCRGDDLIPKNKRFGYMPPVQEENYKFFVGGIGYKSAADACRKLGVNYVTYRKRIAKGFLAEEALGISFVPDGRSERSIKYEVLGELYIIEDLSIIHKIPESTIRYKLKRGATIMQAVGLEQFNDANFLQQNILPKKIKQPINLVVNGKTYKSYKSLADDYGLRDYVVRQRIAKYGYTPQEAVTIEGKGKAVSVGGKSYKSLSEAAKQHGITLEILRARLDQGRNIEEALGLSVYKTSYSIEYEGRIYKNLNDLSQYVGISAGVLSNRIKIGMSLPDAISLGRVINSGRYNSTILSRDVALASKQALLYFVEIEINGLLRHKIGITTKTIKQRLDSEGYKYSVIQSVKGSLIECFNLEQELLELLKEKRDNSVSSEMLDGYSEIFNLSSNDVMFVKEKINDWQVGG